MLLIDQKYRLDVRSTAEMTSDDLALLRIPLESSKVIKDHESANRPRRGGIVFGFVPLLMTYILMECRKTTYRGIVKNLSEHDCACLGLPLGKDGRFRRPSAATLNGFVNGKLAGLTEKIGLELSSEVMKALPTHVIATMDSTPLEASRYNFDADFSPHYNIKMDKGHMLMVNGHIMSAEFSKGNAHDNPFAEDLIKGLTAVNFGGKTFEFHSDGGYDAFDTYADVYLATGSVMRCNQGTDAVYSGVDETRIRKEYNKMWKHRGYDRDKRNDTDFMLRFLCDNGEKETVGAYLRDKSMRMNENDGGTKARHICETVHRAMKRWVDFSIFRLRKASKDKRMRCRLLCAQLLSVLFIEYIAA